MKTCSKFKKCFKVLGGGGLKRKRVGGNHFLLKKTKRVKGLLSKNIILLGKIESTVKKRLFV
jgi:ribosomal protein L35